MAHLLHRLGASSVRRPFAVIIIWFLTLGAAVAGYFAFSGPLATSFNIPGTETAEVNDRISEKLDGVSGAAGTVVFQTADDEPFTEAESEDISAFLNEFTEIDGVATVIDPFITTAELQGQGAQIEAGLAQLDPDDPATAPQYQELLAASQLLEYAAEIRAVSDDGTTAMAVIQFEQDIFDMPQDLRDEVAADLDAFDMNNLTISYSSEIAESIEGIIGAGEVIGVIIAGIVLLVMFRAALPATLPLISSLVGVGVGVTAAMAFSGVVDMNSVTPVLGVMLGLAVGIDYSLFIINKHRIQIRDGISISDSIPLANGTAGNAVVFAGSTVAIALLALNITGIPFLGLMGTVGAACVVIAVLVSISLTPALLALIGPRVLPRRSREALGSAQDVAEAKPMSNRRAWASTLIGVVALAVIAIPSFSLRLGLPDGSSDPAGSTTNQTYNAVSENFGPGQNNPLVVAVETDAAPDEGTALATQIEYAGYLFDQPDVVAVAPAAISEDGEMYIFQVIPREGANAESTEALVKHLRDLEPLAGGDELLVAGQTSGNIDISDRLAGVLPLYLTVVVGLSLVILITVFRSLLIPLIATGGFILSVFAALGSVVAIYQWGWLGSVFGVEAPGPVLSFLPIILVGVLFGLAMDYQLFLGSGMREAYVHGAHARLAVARGFHAGRAVVTAAAIIMIAVFGGFVFSHLTMVRPIGFGLAVGVLFDAFVVRMLITPAVLHLAGEGAWWLPRWLDRILPNVDVEGSALEREVEQAHHTDASNDTVAEHPPR